MIFGMAINETSFPKTKITLSTARKSVITKQVHFVDDGYVGLTNLIRFCFTVQFSFLGNLCENFGKFSQTKKSHTT